MCKAYQSIHSEPESNSVKKGKTRKIARKNIPIKGSVGSVKKRRSTTIFDTIACKVLNEASHKRFLKSSKTFWENFLTKITLLD